MNGTIENWYGSFLRNYSTRENLLLLENVYIGSQEPIRGVFGISIVIYVVTIGMGMVLVPEKKPRSW